jgi:hypothetical protein
MYFNQSFVLTTGAPNREEINPNKLGKVDIVRADRDFKDSLFDFFARMYERCTRMISFARA